MPKPLQDYALPVQLCPYCGAEVEGACSVDGSAPQPGDPNICSDCLEVSVFGVDLKLHKLTTEELDAMDPDWRAELEAIRRVLRQRAKKPAPEGPIQ